MTNGRYVTRLKEIGGSSYISTVHPSLRDETSSMRDLLPELRLQHTISTISYSALRKRRRDARLRGEDCVVGKTVYHADLVSQLLTWAQAKLPAVHNDRAAAILTSQTAPDSDVDAQGNDETIKDAQNVDDDLLIADALASSKRRQTTTKVTKRKFYSSGVSADGHSATRADKRRLTATDGCESPNVGEGEREDAVAAAVTSPHFTQSAAESAHASIATPAVGKGEQMPSAVQYTEGPTHKPYSSKAEFEADRALFGRKHGLAKARMNREAKDTGHDSPKEAQNETALGTVCPAIDILCANAGAGSDVEDDDDAGGGSEAQARTNVSTWHTSTTYRDHRNDSLTLEQITKADALAASCPLELWRVSAATGISHTQGMTSQQCIGPAAVVEGVKNGMPVYEDLSDFPSLSALSKNLAGRLLYTQSSADEFTSYSDSLLFALVLARRREALGQGDISISRIATCKATTRSGKQAKFYSAPELLNILGVTEWNGLSDRARGILIGTRFHHEYVALGELDLTRNPYRPVQFDELKAYGLYDFRPGLHIEGNEVEEKKLYYRRLQLSHQWYGPEAMENLDGDASDFTGEHLEHAAKLARLFDPTVHGFEGNRRWYDNPPNAPLSIFLDFVGLFRRRKNDQLFARYIGDTYSKNEVQSVLYEGMEQMYNNLPDRMQVMDRIREACIAISVPEPSAINVMLVDVLFDFDGAWHGDLRKITGAIAPRKKSAKTSRTRASAAVRQALGDSTLARSVDAGSTSHSTRNDDLLTHHTVWDNGNEQNYMYESALLVDDELRAILNECKKQMAEGTRRTCWISGCPVGLTDDLLTQARLATLDNTDTEQANNAAFEIWVALLRLTERVDEMESKGIVKEVEVLRFREAVVGMHKKVHVVKEAFWNKLEAIESSEL
ncbi:hypothetical protein LTR56_016103 [Elasticomyces elasticus]|nr:hypothetical protein LTR56_016103 [Elasticomyces elasticus]KAK3653836.1 hypothetical protein LTR22_011051 [Elasticomyces elasticus]KAK4916038.1 hypothetical protein LTR49_015949 [Elasticomyces elasticus]KAK5755420.1 hypothetical protein LTS12_014527 [Elasticomyces elasticus]